MRFDIQKAFPYPVLRPYSDDYVDGEFQASVQARVDQEKVDINVYFALSVEEILQQIEAGRASYVAIISCRDTYFRDVIVSSTATIAREYAINTLRGEVVVDAYVVAIDSIENFFSQDINPEFGHGSFNFSRGDVLAQDEPQVFFIERDYFKPVTSVFDLVMREDLQGGEWTVSLSQDRVQIEVSREMKEAIDRARNASNNQMILINSIYFAAVVHVVQQLKDARSEFEDYRWATVFLRQIHNRDINLDSEDAYKIAQQLMEYPLILLKTQDVFGGD